MLATWVQLSRRGPFAAALVVATLYYIDALASIRSLSDRMQDYVVGVKGWPDNKSGLHQSWLSPLLGRRVDKKESHKFIRSVCINPSSTAEPGPRRESFEWDVGMLLIHGSMLDELEKKKR